VPAGVGRAAAGSRQDRPAGEGGSARSHPLYQVPHFLTSIFFWHIRDLLTLLNLFQFNSHRYAMEKKKQ